MTAAAQLAVRWLEDHSSFEDECTSRTSQAIRTLIEEVKGKNEPARALPPAFVHIEDCDGDSLD